jgi:26S proteasome regulatory subunit N8
MSIKTNDQLMAIYLSSLIRAITAFHDLIENKIQNKPSEDPKGPDEDPKEDEIKPVGADDPKTNGVNGDASTSDEKNGTSGTHSKPKGS